MRRRAPVGPTDLPSDAPDELRREYDEAQRALSELRKAEADAAHQRERTHVLVERYEMSLLRHRGQLTLFGEAGDGTHEPHQADE